MLENIGHEAIYPIYCLKLLTKFTVIPIMIILVERFNAQTFRGL